MIPPAVVVVCFGGGSEFLHQYVSVPRSLCNGLDMGGGSSAQPRPSFLQGLPGTGLCDPAGLLNA